VSAHAGFFDVFLVAGVATGDGTFISLSISVLMQVRDIRDLLKEKDQSLINVN